MKERGITIFDVEYVLEHPQEIRKGNENRFIAIGKSNHRRIKVVFERENYIKIVTVI